MSWIQKSALTALGQNQLDAQVHVAIGAFNSQFAFSLIIFGVYLILLGWLAYRSGYVPKWVGIAVAIAGAGWLVMESGPYLLPGIDVGFLFVASFGELILLVWLVGWGRRLSDMDRNIPAAFAEPVGNPRARERR